MLCVSASVCAALLCCRDAASVCICLASCALWALVSNALKNRYFYMLPAFVSALLALYCLSTAVGFAFAAVIFAAGAYASRRDRLIYAPPLMFMTSVFIAVASLIAGEYLPMHMISDIPKQVFAVLCPASVMYGKGLSKCLLGAVAAIPIAALLIIFFSAEAYSSALALLCPALIGSQIGIFGRENE